MQFMGCDVSKATLDLAYFKQSWQVTNTRQGWEALLNWAEQNIQAPFDELCVVMEATGVYHLKAAAYLATAGLKVIVANPGRSADYARSQNQLNKNDRLDARALARYGAQLHNPHWYVPESTEISQLKTLLSRLGQLGKDLQRERNRLEKCAFLAGSQLLRRSVQRQIKALTREQTLIQRHIDQLIKEDESLQRNQQLMCSIKGIGKITSQWLLPLLSTQRFNHAREVAAFLGLVPCHKSSGTSLQSRGQLSGRGNKDLRARLYMPAISAATNNPQLRAFYQTLLARGKTPKQALTAVMRKLVHICYGVIKHQTPYQENYAA
jgi:transposase